MSRKRRCQLEGLKITARAPRPACSVSSTSNACTTMDGHGHSCDHVTAECLFHIFSVLFLAVCIGITGSERVIISPACVYYLFVLLRSIINSSAKYSSLRQSTQRNRPSRVWLLYCNHNFIHESSKGNPSV